MRGQFSRFLDFEPSTWLISAWAGEKDITNSPYLPPCLYGGPREVIKVTCQVCCGAVSPVAAGGSSNSHQTKDKRGWERLCSVIYIYPEMHQTQECNVP